MNATAPPLEDVVMVPDERMVALFEFYYTPVLVGLGSIGNLLAVYVFFSTKLRKLSSSYYLAALAVSDTGFLLTLLVVWLRMVNVDLFNQPVACPAFIYLSGMFSFLSVWLVVAFTVERFVAVCYPLLRQSICTVSRAKLILLIITLLAMAFNAPLILVAHLDPDSNMCWPNAEWENLANIFNALDTVTTYVVPVFTILILNTCISRTVWRLASVRRRLTQRYIPGDVRATKRRTTVRQKNGSMSQHKVTKMLLIVSTAFLCLSLPSYIMRMITYLISMKYITTYDKDLLINVQHFCLLLFNTNFGINFALYCISGQNFRKAAAKSLHCIISRGSRNEAVALTVSESRTQSTVSSAVTSKRRRLPPITQEYQHDTLTPAIHHIVHIKG